jgi:hypothetical protein
MIMHSSNIAVIARSADLDLSGSAAIRKNTKVSCSFVLASLESTHESCPDEE